MNTLSRDADMVCFISSGPCRGSSGRGCTSEQGADADGAKPPYNERQRGHAQGRIIELLQCPEQHNCHLPHRSRIGYCIEVSFLSYLLEHSLHAVSQQATKQLLVAFCILTSREEANTASFKTLSPKTILYSSGGTSSSENTLRVATGSVADIRAPAPNVQEIPH